MGKKKARVFIIDNNRLFIEAFLFLCGREGKISVVGFSSTGKGVLPELQRKRPDVVIVDAGLADIDAVALVRSITTELEGTKVIIISIHDNPELVQRAFQGGASAFLLKGTPGRKILKTVCHLISQ